MVDNLTWTRGRNTFKFGGEYDHELLANMSGTAPTFSFTGLTPLNGRPAVSALNQYQNAISGDIDPATGQRYSYTFLTSLAGNPNVRLPFSFLNFFAQDEIRLTPSFVVNIGARYELILFPVFDASAPYALSRSIPNDYRDIAPRVAVSYSPGGNPKTVIHAAYGIYYDVPSLSIFYNAAQLNGDRLLSYQVAGTTPGAPVFPGVPNFSQTSFQVKPNITAFDPNFHNAYQHQANLQVQRELGKDFILTAGYIFAALRHGLYYGDSNLTPSGRFLADGRPTYLGTAIRPNTNFGAVNLIHSGAGTNFSAGFLTLQKRLTRNVEFSVNYTYSHALADNLGEGGVISDPSDVHRDYGDADDDVRHNLTIQGLFRPSLSGERKKWLNGFEFSSTTFINSGFPINPIAGTDLNNDGVVNDRPIFVARNSLPSQGLSQEDVELKRYFDYREKYHFSAFVVTENLLNTNNLNCNTATGCTGAVVNTENSSSFLTETSARTSRNLQVGLDLHF